MISGMCYVSLERSQSFLTEGNLSTAEDKDGTVRYPLAAAAAATQDFIFWKRPHPSAGPGAGDA